MRFRTTLRGETFTFRDLRDVFAKANEEKSGDQLAGISARNEKERVAAKVVLADQSVADVVDYCFVDDDVSALIAETRRMPGSLRALTFGELRDYVLEPNFPTNWDREFRHVVTPEVAAGLAKIMGTKDLVLAASRLRVVTTCRNTQGADGTLGVRVQPNHPTDDVHGVVLSAIDGLRHGCGDAMLGVNPANDDVGSVVRLLRGLHDLIEHVAVPTQSCVLSHVTTQIAALRRGAPVDLLFQSVAGTQGANASFGVTLELLREAREEVAAHHATRRDEFPGEHFMYFETGQGTALSAEAHEGVDQLTLEARAQAVAGAFDPFLVNTVVGFIGPEYLATARQITRAGLEDHFVGKLQGIPMGADVCYTNHVDADQNSNDELMLLLATAGCNFLMGVPAADDVMLHYQSTSFQDVTATREILRRGPAPEFSTWLESQEWWRGPHTRSPRPLVGELRRALGAP